MTRDMHGAMWSPRALACWVAAWLLLAGAAAGENLLPDPGFEQVGERDRFGRVFPAWDGWIYDGAGRFDASPIAHSGNYSCQITADSGAMIRMFSKELPTAPGRYRLTMYLRGIDLTKTSNFHMFLDFDGKSATFDKVGSFGWTPLTYVFDVPPNPRKKMRLYVGLSSGRVWIDDASIVKVDESVELTPQPVFGAEEAPIEATAELGPDAVHCTSCGYRSPRAADACRVCGQSPAAPALSPHAGPPVKRLYDFEDGSLGIFDYGRIVTDNAPQGRYALGSDSHWMRSTAQQDWSGYDYLVFEAYNPSDKTIRGTFMLRDKQSRDYWTQVNTEIIYPPGRSTIRMRTDWYVGEKARPGRALMTDQITTMVIGHCQGVVLDDFRLERLDTSAANVPGLVALKFGPLGAPGMEGFRFVTGAEQYSPGRGYGWQNAKIWRAFNALQPDALTQSFVCPMGGTFRQDLPNGRYHVELNIDSPGGFWGEVQLYERRKITANGKLVVDETMDCPTFIQRLYRNANREDLPGLDAFEAYVTRMFSPKRFTVDVTDGKLEIGFHGEYWANCLSHIVIYPDAQKAAGEKFLAWVAERRKTQFNEYFRQIEPKRSPAPESGYVLFTRELSTPVHAYDGPRDGETIGPEGLAIAVAGGETSALNFAVQPSQDLGAIDLEVSTLTSEQGGTLDPSILRPGWLDYRIARMAMDGTSWRVEPRYWHPTPAPSAGTATRRFWIQVSVPAGTAPGTYRGTVTLRPQQGEARSIPVAVRVLPFDLDEVDIAVGPFGATINLPWIWGNPDTGKWNWTMFEKSLEAIRAAGCTTFAGMPSITVKAAGGKIELDTAQADRQMALIRAKGFKHVISGYGAFQRLGYEMYGTRGPDEAAAKKAGFPNFEAYLRALYTAIDEHAVANDWLPVAYNLCDEPVDSAVPPMAASAAVHKKIAQGLKRTTFMGCTSLAQRKADEPITKHGQYPLVTALPLATLNVHDDAALEAIRQAGGEFGFYNATSRWTFGRYLRFLATKHDLKMRLSWHFNTCAGDPYYALDCREDDFNWYNTDADGTMVPNVQLLGTIIPGLNDYRYLTTLQRLLNEKPDHPAASTARAVLDEQLDLRVGKDRGVVSKEPTDKGVNPDYAGDRRAVTAAIESLLK